MQSVLTEGDLRLRIVSVFTTPIVPFFVTWMVSFAPTGSAPALEALEAQRRRRARDVPRARAALALPGPARGADARAGLHVDGEIPQRRPAPAGGERVGQVEEDARRRIPGSDQDRSWAAGPGRNS